MISESAPWKDELAAFSAELTRCMQTPAGDDFEDFALERPLFYSALVLRKLIENWKVTDALRDRQIAITTYPANQSRLGVLTRTSIQGHIDKEFDLEAPSPATMVPKDLASEIMHSAYVAWMLDDDLRIQSICLCSFRNEKTRLIEFKLADFISLLDAFVSDDVQEKRQWIDPDTGKMKVQLL